MVDTKEIQKKIDNLKNHEIHIKGEVLCLCEKA